MSSQRYERISGHEADDDHDQDLSPVKTATRGDHHHTPIPASPPPSFRSRASSPTSRHLLSHDDPLASDADRALADSFDAPSDSEGADSDAEDEGDDRQRLMRGNPTESRGSGEGSSPTDRPGGIERRVTQLPAFESTPAGTTTNTTSVPAATRTHGSRVANDGVFANLSAKPERGEKLDEQPPTYEQAAADATPPYWETTILAPGVGSDEVFIDGLPVGSIFSFIWNGMISTSFQLVGFLLTYLLHTTHAAKNGSKAGLGITLIQFGFYMKGAKNDDTVPGEPTFSEPTDPNGHNFDPSNAASGSAGGEEGPVGHMGNNEWLAYAFMVVGWFILIRSVSNFIKARRHEQLVLQSPDRGLNVPIVAEGEAAETVV
ncbi:MAG: hypothetical protein M4579_007473 [Chaenotheca gracillima]|nr:MAG: hypothetical protein M4579_007473 [Chaenotheca gracillima]